MNGIESNHCKILQKSLSGKRAIDRQTYASLAVLNDRLQRLKKNSPAYEKVKFSNGVLKLAKKKNAVTTV